MLQNMQWKVKNIRTVLFLARVVYTVRRLSHYCSMKWLGLGQVQILDFRFEIWNAEGNPLKGIWGHPPLKNFKIRVLGNGIFNILRPSPHVIM